MTPDKPQAVCQLLALTMVVTPQIFFMSQDCNTLSLTNELNWIRVLVTECEGYDLLSTQTPHCWPGSFGSQCSAFL